MRTRRIGTGGDLVSPTATETLQPWLDAALAGMESMTSAFGLERCELLGYTAGLPEADGGYIALEGQRFSYLVGLASTPEGSHALTRSFAGLEAEHVGPSEIADVLGEMANMIAGTVKARVAEIEPGLTTGLPMFVRGQLHTAATKVLGASLRMGGHPMWLLVLKQPISAEMLERRRIERALADREARLRAFLQNAADGILTVDDQGLVESLNPAGLRILGYDAEALVGRPASVLLPELERLEGAQGAETVGARRDGRTVPLELTLTDFFVGDRRMMAGIFRDVTARRQLEIELRHAQKLQSVGQLAGGVAHELNTPIQFVSSNLHFLRDGMRDLATLIDAYRSLRRELEGTSVAHDALARAAAAEEQADLDYLLENLPPSLDQALEGMERMAHIVRSMKVLASAECAELAALDLREAIASTLTVANGEIAPVADVDTELADLPPITCHPGEINQVILAIVRNAAQAVADAIAGTQSRGRITIRTSHQDGHAVIAVADTGCGVPEEIRDRIFDPFFTTRPVGDGTGQGLAVARSVVCDKHRGKITLETRVGRGTTFFIHLPIDGPGSGSAGG